MRPPSVVSAWNTGASLPTGSSPSDIRPPRFRLISAAKMAPARPPGNDAPAARPGTHPAPCE